MYLRYKRLLNPQYNEQWIVSTRLHQ
jgi:hypothetical protein